MEIIKKAECNISRDANILAVTNDFIVVNNVSNGITIFDANLKVIRDLPLADNLTIRHIYTNHAKNELILYCPDNRCVIWVDISNVTHKIIPFSERLSERALSPAYYWLGDLVIFVPRDFEIYCALEEYYELNIPTATWDIVSFDVLKYASPGLANLIETIFITSDFQLRDGYITLESCQYYPEFTVVIYRDSFLIERPAFAYHDVLYAHNLIVFVGLEQLQIAIPLGDQHDRDYQKMILEVPEWYQFLKVAIDYGSQGLRLVALCTGQEASLIVAYQVYGVSQVPE